MRSHDSSMKVHDKKRHVLVTMEAFSKLIIIYAFQQNPSRKVEWNKFCLQKYFLKIMGKQQNI